MTLTPRTYLSHRCHDSESHFFFFFLKVCGACECACKSDDDDSCSVCFVCVFFGLFGTRGMWVIHFRPHKNNKKKKKKKREEKIRGRVGEGVPLSSLFHHHFVFVYEPRAQHFLCGIIEKKGKKERKKEEEGEEMKRIFCAPSVGGDSKLSCGTIRRGKTSNRNNSDEDDDDDETKMNSTTRSKEKWSNAYEKFRKEASDLTEEEAKELWRKTKQCMQQEDEVQLRLYAELDLIYGSDDEDEDAGEEIGDDDDEKKKNKKAADEKNTKLKRNSQKHKDLVHERVRIALANEIRQKAIEADSVDPFDMIMSSSDQSLEKVGLSRIRSAR